MFRGVARALILLRRDSSGGRHASARMPTLHACVLHKAAETDFLAVADWNRLAADGRVTTRILPS